MKDLSLGQLLTAIYFLYKLLGTKVSVSPATMSREKLESAAKAARNKVLETTNLMPSQISWKALGSMNYKTFSGVQKAANTDPDADEDHKVSTVW